MNSDYHLIECICEIEFFLNNSLQTFKVLTVFDTKVFFYIDL